MTSNLFAIIIQLCFCTIYPPHFSKKIRICLAGNRRGVVYINLPY